MKPLMRGETFKVQVQCSKYKNYYDLDDLDEPSQTDSVTLFQSEKVQGCRFQTVESCPNYFL